MFRHLRTKLTVLYASLFTATLLLISVTVYYAISASALSQGRKELATSGAVFDRVWDLRAAQLENGAALLSRDFGFRAAVASTDAPTIRTALDNLQDRLGIDLALLIGADGRVVAADGQAVLPDPQTLAALRADLGDSGVVVIGGMPYEAVSVPVMAPMDMGSVVFATKLDERQLHSLEGMAAVPLTAQVRYRQAPGRWSGGVNPEISAALDTALRALGFAAQGPMAQVQAPRTLPSPQGSALTLVKPLRVIDPRQPAVLVLQYPIREALAPYRLLFGILLGAGALGLIAVIAGAGALARNVTQPISALEDAARRLKRGEQAAVHVATRDEIGRLAETFNGMAAEIIQRQTETEETAAALEVARDRAEAANRAKSSFLANMSHEVRTPLNGVLGVAGLLAQTPLDGKQAAMVAIIENSASVLRRVLNDVLDLARVEAGRLDIVREPFNLEVAVSALASASDVQCRGKGLGFTLHIDDAARRFVLGDRVRLEQILGNLLNNAVKFTDTGEISLSVGVDPHDPAVCRFEVRDTGVGFDKAVAATLFQPFKQADDSITRRYGGSGLGLSISRELARAMDGDITVAAELGRGATFTLTAPLPRCDGPADASTDPAHPASALVLPLRAEADPEAPLQVLLADDHETNRTVVGLILDSVGVALTSVENGALAVEAFKARRFDVVLMDMQMPVMDGLTAIRQIRAWEAQTRAAPTPILVLSANAMAEHVAGSVAAGADGHVAKPITAPALIAALDDILSPSDEREAVSA